MFFVCNEYNHSMLANKALFPVNFYPYCSMQLAGAASNFREDRLNYPDWNFDRRQVEKRGLLLQT